MESDSPKRRQILSAAREVFGELGFERGSVEHIAARANVSKATVYSHFTDKKALFVACFSEEADTLRQRLREFLGEPTGAIKPALEAAGKRLLEMLLSPTIVALYRQVTAESARFPEIGEMLFERGPRVVNRALAAYLERWADKGQLHFEDPSVAAMHFSMLCQGDLYLRASLGILSPGDAEIRRYVERGVRAFLKAYGR